MPRSVRKFSAVATALIVLAAHVLCVCRTAGAFATAAAAAAPSPAGMAADAHACCERESRGDRPDRSDHSKGHDGQCRHCAASQTPAIKSDTHRHGDGTTLHATFQSFESPVTCAGHSFVLPGRVDRPRNVSSPTLLRLGCALNL